MKNHICASLVSTLLCLASAQLFKRYLCINLMSLLPLVLMIISVIMTSMFRDESKATVPHEFQTQYTPEGLRLPERMEYSFLFKAHTISKLYLLPMLTVFVLYFGLWWKMLSFLFFWNELCCSENYLQYIFQKNREVRG